MRNLRYSSIRIPRDFDGEIEAIVTAVQQLLYRTNQFQKAVILSDSQAAIEAIVNMDETPSSQIKNIRTIIKQLSNLKKKITLQWIPAHCGIHGNEKADSLAKKGTEIIATQSRDTPFQSAKRLIKNQSNNLYKIWISKEAENKKWKEILEKPGVIRERPRKTAVATFRLLTGHDCLANTYIV